MILKWVRILEEDSVKVEVMSLLQNFPLFPLAASCETKAAIGVILLIISGVDIKLLWDFSAKVF